MRKIERISIDGADREPGATGQGPEHAPKGRLESADRAFGERWADGGSDCGSGRQELADDSTLAPPPCGRGDRGAFHRTVEDHRASATKKLAVKNKVELTRLVASSF
jgi:hypothetical protein